MSILVRVIFWGLIGFVPNEEGHKGLTALFVDPDKIPLEAGTCPIPQHVPVVYLLDGECEADKGKCIQIPTGREPDVATHLGEKIPKLRWLVKNEDLEIFGQESKVEFHHRGRKSFLGKLRKAPQRAGQAADYAWVQSMGSLTSGYGEIREDCLLAGPTCPLKARFKIRGGRASACHLFHKSEEHPKGRNREVVVFDYFENRGGDRVRIGQQAVADAIQVEFEVEGDHVDLRSWGLDADHGQQNPKASVRLKPSRPGRTVTLIVVNTPRHQEHEAGCTPHPHSEALFSLLARKPAFPLERREISTKGSKPKRVNPGSCEAEITYLAQARYGDKGDKKMPADIAFEAPHSTTSCDGASYP